MECIVMVLGLLCFDGVKSPGANVKTCKIPKEMGYIVCMKYPDCNIVHGVNVGYASETYIKKHNTKWCETSKD